VGVSTGVGATSLAHAMRSLASIMDDCSELVETTMQWLSQSPTAREIDREMGTVQPALGGAPRLSYLRYNVTLEPEWFRKHLALDWSADKVAALAAMDKPENMAALDEVGKVAGAKLVEGRHFPAAFDLR
jgi:hypothetical protein